VIKRIERRGGSRLESNSRSNRGRKEGKNERVGRKEMKRKWSNG